MLIDYGADVTVKAEKGLTPLHFAVKYNYPEIVNLLLDANANIHERGNLACLFMTPIVMARVTGKGECIKLFKEQAKYNLFLSEILPLLLTLSPIMIAFILLLLAFIFNR